MENEERLGEFNPDSVYLSTCPLCGQPYDGEEFCAECAAFEED